MKLKKLFQWIRILLFTVVLVGGCVLGFILSLRPSVSESEGRELTKFPAFSVESFLSGSTPLRSACGTPIPSPSARRFWT